MNERRKPYPFDKIEPKWQAIWDEKCSFRARNPGDAGFDAAQPKFYVLDMFPYPSGAGLHVGHPEGYTATDIVARYKRLRGFNVLHPMGWDAFGLPAEQYAIKTGQHPAITTRENIAKFKAQLKRIGFSYDWQREINTTDPAYYKWTQWIFLKIYNSWLNPETQKTENISTYRGANPDDVRLAYVAEVPVNWCQELGTVLANEEVVDGKSEVGGFPVVRRPMRQWMLRITAFAERLIDELEELDWPESIKALQRNWIGRSEGAEIKFAIAEGSAGFQPARSGILAGILKSDPKDAGKMPANSDKMSALPQIRVFTTRPDTLYGATYMVLSPENSLVDQITTQEQRDAVAKYRAEIASKSDLERTDLAKEKGGVFTGAFALNPVNSERIPIWIADYVLMGYGTGAIMGVPAHDERDFEFARQYRLPVRRVVERTEDGFVSCPSRVTNPASGESAARRVELIEKGFYAPLAQTEIHTRHLPHWQQDDAFYFLTWRLADSLPNDKLKELRGERESWLAVHPKPWSALDEEEFHERFSNRIDDWLDAGAGSCLLLDPANAQIMVDALRFFDGQRYELHGFCVMPNHVHVLVRLFPDKKLPDVVHSWKRHSAREINRRRQREGALWQDEYYDRLVRSWDHFASLRRYIANNPEKAGLLSQDIPTWLRETEDGFGSRPGRVTNPASAPSVFTGEGIAVNSPLIDGLPTDRAKTKIIDWLEEHGHGRRNIRYKLRDWLFSRQRYWGEPFPVIWRDGKHAPLAETELPLVPPALDDFKPTGTGEPPLAKAKDWIRYSDNATRETNTMPQWAGSCWYYLRFCDPQNTTRFVGDEAERYWMGTQRISKLTRSEWEKRLRELDASAGRPHQNRKHFITFSVVTAERAKRIEASTGLRVEGFREFIDVFAIRHIKWRHGSQGEKRADHFPVEFEDLLLLPDIVTNPDKITSGGKTSLGLPSIRYEKRVNGTIIYLEETLLGRRLLAAKTMSKAKATASHAREGLTQTPETLRRTDEIIAEIPLPVNERNTGGVDLYIGGVEHAVLHLLYARFWHKVLFDLGYVSKPEPFQRLVNQGMILGEDNRKMSKRWGNVIDPLDVIEIYGADAFRCYEMFMGPLEQMKPWSMKGVEGASRFLARVWRLVMEENQAGDWILCSEVRDVEPEKTQLKVLHATIKKVTVDIETLSFNTAISQMMILVNALTNSVAKPVSALRKLLVVLNPFAPHLTSELWQTLHAKFAGAAEEITAERWPDYDQSLLIEDEIEIVLQVNGKVRARIVVPLEATNAELEAAAIANEKVQSALAGKTVQKIVVVLRRLVNIVAT